MLTNGLTSALFWVSVPGIICFLCSADPSDTSVPMPDFTTDTAFDAISVQNTTLLSLAFSEQAFTSTLDVTISKRLSLLSNQISCSQRSGYSLSDGIGSDCILITWVVFIIIKNYPTSLYLFSSWSTRVKRVRILSSSFSISTKLLTLSYLQGSFPKIRKNKYLLN